MTDSLPTDVILTPSHEFLGQVYLDWMPQPGTHLELEGKAYTILERRHHYRLKAGRYRLSKIALYVQSAHQLAEGSWVGDRWLVGDVSCRFNARSALIRCAVNPAGPCQGCRFYEE